MHFRFLVPIFVLASFLIPVAVAQAMPRQDPAVAGNKKIEALMKSFTPRGIQADDSQPTAPQDALKLFRTRAGVEVDLVAHEPEISQPLFLTWDSRGRMWVVQYRQYQFPAGLKVVRYDQHLRAVFDKVPEPPPLGARGLDRVTVLEDTDGDGLYDVSKDVITGLNIASSVQVGPNGIWVLNPPYLLFYPDANGDDVPDGDPEVHLSGFGLQDTHSVANNLIWGPDGWLYGANGSTTVGTVSSKVTKGIGFEGQCIWRYHPTTNVFEIFAEGGGNTFSLEIDSKGRVFSGTNGGAKRGYYYPQGSYADKNWGKHGPLTNPYAFGYFHGMKMEGDQRRFAQAFLVYEGGLFPAKYQHSIVAPNSLHNLVWHSDLIEDGSNYRTVDNENLLDSSDRWFRPVYSGVGPDGAIYIADWYDTRLSHISPIDDWHKSSGRIYRVRPAGTLPTYEGGNLHELASQELIAKFDDSNKWVRRRAMLELGWRGDRSVIDTLVELVNRDASLESLWALNLMSELSTERAVAWMQHEDAHIRRWAVRLMGDRHEGHPAMAQLAARESDLQVRSQLASTAKRVDAPNGLAIIEQLVQRDEDLKDPHLPLMYWWAFEGHADQWPVIESLLSKKTFWHVPLVREIFLDRLMQRYASRGTADDLTRCNRLIELAPDQTSQKILITGLNKAFQGRAIPKLPAQLDEALAQYQASLGDVGAVFALRAGRKDAVNEAVRLLRNGSTELGIRIELARAFGERQHAEAIDPLLRLATGTETNEPSLQRVAIRSLASYDDKRVANQLIGSLYSRISTEQNMRATAIRTLASRKDSALALLNEVNQWRLKTTDVPADVVQQLRAFDDAEIEAATDLAFGKAVAISTPEKVTEIKRLQSLLSDWSGNADAGKIHFMKNCGNCHKLFGEGQQIGPPLDSYARGDLKFWLPAIIEPSLEIREGYQSYKATTADGRQITGMIEAQDPNTVTFRTADTQRVILARNDLEDLRAVETSLMPEQLLKELTDQQIKDLLAYMSLGARTKQILDSPR